MTGRFLGQWLGKWDRGGTEAGRGAGGEQTVREGRGDQGQRIRAGGAGPTQGHLLCLHQAGEGLGRGGRLFLTSRSHSWSQVQGEALRASCHDQQRGAVPEPGDD